MYNYVSFLKYIQIKSILLYNNEQNNYAFSCHILHFLCRIFPLLSILFIFCWLLNDNYDYSIINIVFSL